MNALRRCFAVLVWCCILGAGASYAGEPKVNSPAAAKAATGDIDAKLAGHYYLSGIMETGSELMLRPDGRFQWYLAYGALDLTAEGRWQRDGKVIVLDPDAVDGPAEFPEPRFQRMQLRIDGDDLIPAWPWEDGAERGRYSRE